MKPGVIITVGALVALIVVGSLAAAGYFALQMVAVAKDEIAIARTEAESLRQATASMPKIVTAVPFEDLRPSRR